MTTRTVRADVSLSHRRLIGQSVTILAECGDLFDNGNEWFEVQTADGEVTHLMAKEMDAAHVPSQADALRVMTTTQTAFDWLLNETAAAYAVTPYFDGPEHGPQPMPASIPAASVAPATRAGITACIDASPVDRFEAVTPGQLIVGDVVTAHGMVLLITDAPRLSTAHAGNRTFYTAALVCNREAVSHDAVPYGYTASASRATDPAGTHRWTIQGNDHAAVLRFRFDR